VTRVLRAAAIVIAVLALFDPAFAVKKAAPLPVEVLLPAGSDPEYAAAAEKARQIADSLGDRITTGSAESPRARVSLGGALPPDLSLPIIALPPDSAAGVTITAAAAAPTVAGQAVEIAAVLRGQDLSGRTSTISLMDRGVAVARTQHTWTSDRSDHHVQLSYAAPAAGLVPLTVSVETPGVDAAAADIAATVTARALRVLVYEPRPSWAAAFIRRALEAESRFIVAGLSRSAPRIATRVGTAPVSLDAVILDDFDVIAVGAPEALVPAELTPLDRFASVRGGTVLLLPDTRLPASVQEKFALPRTEEMLLQVPVRTELGASSVEASELLLPLENEPFSAMAPVTVDGTERAAIFSVPHGDGAVVLSGMMDAWRYRRREANRFWQGLIADLSSAAPPALSVRVDPALARPGDRVHLTATWRRDRIEAGNAVRVPATRATISDGKGGRTPVRLWPGERAGVYEAWLEAPAAGTYEVAAEGDGVRAAAVLGTRDNVRHSAAGWSALARIARHSGGAVVQHPDQVRQQLERLAAPDVEESRRPMRSPWWIVPFAGCLCTEWLIRRRQGLR
jgi:hypothetical protein